MSGSVDVMAVMDADGRAVALLSDEYYGAGKAKLAEQWSDHLSVHDKARAAVAELIERLPDPETLKRCMEAGSREYAKKWRDSVEAGNERRDFYEKSVFLGHEAGAAAAALARVQGGAE